MIEGGHEAVAADEDVVGTSRVRELERRVREQDAHARAQDDGGRGAQGGPRRGARKKTSVAASVLERAGGRFAVKAAADTLGVARSNLVERGGRPARPRGPYRKLEDDLLLPTIRQIVDERPWLTATAGSPCS